MTRNRMTIRLGAALVAVLCGAGAAQAEPVLSGLFDLTAPEGWQIDGAPDAPLMRLHAPGGGTLAVARGAGLTGPQGLLSALPADLRGQGATRMGQRVWAYGWPDAAQPGVENRLDVFVFCLAGDEPFALWRQGPADWVEAEGLTAAEAALRLTLTGAARACPAGQARRGPQRADWQPAPLSPTPLPPPMTAPASAAPVPTAPVVEAAPAPAPAVAPAPVAPAVTAAPAAPVVAPAPAAAPTPDPVTSTPLPPPVAAPAPTAVTPPPAVAAPPLPAAHRVVLYENPIYGTAFHYPGDVFQPVPGAETDEGAAFASADGRAELRVVVHPDPGFLSATDILDSAAEGLSRVRDASTPDWDAVTGRDGDTIVFSLVAFDEGIFHQLTLRYPADQADIYQPIRDDILASFAPAQYSGPDWEGETTVPPFDLDALIVPPRGSPLRAALMDAARPGVSDLLGRRVIFVVKELATDDRWAYLSATPVNPDGTPIDWAATGLIGDGDDPEAVNYEALMIRDDEGGPWALLESGLVTGEPLWPRWANFHDLPTELFGVRE